MVANSPDQSDIDPKWMKLDTMSAKGLELLEELMRFKPDGLSANGWAVKAGVSRAIWADLRRHGNPSRRTMEKLLAAAGSSLAEFEALRIGPSDESFAQEARRLAESGREWRQASLALLPIVSSTPAGSWGNSDHRIEQVQLHRNEVIARLPRPFSLASDKDAYGVPVLGDSMWPRFRPGRRVAVSPRAPISIGDDVLVLLTSPVGRPGCLALIKELTRRDANGLGLRQFHPDVGFDIADGEISAVHKVLGEII